MGSAISQSNKSYINDNWNDLKCSPIGPFLQMLGVAPGSAGKTFNQCKSSEFSSQFNSSMTEHLDMTKNLSGGLNAITNTVNSIRKVIASIEQKAFDDLSMIATQLFTIYVKIGNIFFILIKHLINISEIFKQSVNFGAAISKLLIAFIDLLRIPVNAVISLISLFTRR